MSDLQRTDEWFKDRMGRVTASQFSRLITPTGKPSTSAEGYINEILAQIFTKKLPESFTNAHIERGIELEPHALAWFEFETDIEVTESGFIKHPELEAGCSPDGLIGDNGGIEIKCPAPHTHIQYLKDGVLPAKYKAQVQGSMWVTGRDHWWFLSYQPDMKNLLIKVARDQEYIDLLSAEVEKACAKITKDIEMIKEKYYAV